MIGGSKVRELDRSAILFERILQDQGIYLALMFLVDSGYDRKEIELIANRFKKETGK